MKESDIQKSIIDYLAARHILAFRMQVGMANMGGRFVRFGVQGMADILACPQELGDDGDDWRRSGRRPTPFLRHTRPTFLWIEVKSGSRQSALQKSFQQQVEDQGHRYIVARSIDDVAAAL